MKRLLCIAAVMTVVLACRANSWADNFRPYNPAVQIVQSNPPIVFIDVDGAMIDRQEHITARMKVIDNGPGRLNYADTVSHRGQRIDYKGHVGLPGR